MAIVLIDGFDLYNGTGAGTGLQSKWALLSGGGAASQITAGRFGGQALRSVSGSASGNAAYGFRGLPGATPTASAGFGFRASSLDFGQFATGAHIFWMRASGVHQVGLFLAGNGSLQAGRYSAINTVTALGASAPGVITIGTWHFIEVELTISNTVGVFNVYVDGIQVLAISGVKTQNAAVSTVNEVGIGMFNGSGAGAGGPYDHDDLYVTDTAIRLGERRVETLYPMADAAIQWTPSTGAANYALVDEAQANATDFVSASNVGARDLYAVGSLSSTPTSIDAVQVTSFALKTDATTRTLNNSAQSAGVDSDGPAFPLAASYQKFDRILERNPAGNAIWTPAAVNSLLIGPKVAA